MRCPTCGKMSVMEQVALAFLGLTVAGIGYFFFGLYMTFGR